MTFGDLGCKRFVPCKLRAVYVEKINSWTSSVHFETHIVRTGAGGLPEAPPGKMLFVQVLVDKREPPEVSLPHHL